MGTWKTDRTCIWNFLGGSLAGGGIGGVIVGHVIPSMGWKASFWVLGLISVVITFIWYSTVRIAPAPEAAETETSAEKKRTFSVRKDDKNARNMVAFINNVRQHMDALRTSVYSSNLW